MPLAKLLIALTGGIITKVIGDNSINIQGVQGSTININDVSELEQKLTEFIDSSKRPLYFIIFADATVKPHEWKPFGQRSILESVQFCMNNVNNINTVLWFIDPSKPIDEDIEDELKAVKSKSIVLFNTAYDYCPLFKEIFNHYEIGGCIAIPPDKDSKTINLRTLVNIRKDETKMNRLKNTYNYALKNINTDFDIMEAINNIISAYMNYELSQAEISPRGTGGGAKPPTRLPEIR